MSLPDLFAWPDCNSFPDALLRKSKSMWVALGSQESRMGYCCSLLPLCLPVAMVLIESRTGIALGFNWSFILPPSKESMPGVKERGWWGQANFTFSSQAFSSHPRRLRPEDIFPLPVLMSHPPLQTIHCEPQCEEMPLPASKSSNSHSSGKLFSWMLRFCGKNTAFIILSCVT